MSGIPPIAVDHFEYALTDDRIAYEPASPRDSAKLLIYNQEGVIHSRFSELDQFLDFNQLFIVNNTKVIPARFWFTNDKGQVIQIFLLNPLNPDWTHWHAMVGNRRKFKEGDVLHISQDGQSLTVRWVDRENNHVELISDLGSIPEAIEYFGEVPLPPYIERQVSDKDKLDYQAIFAQKDGAVAAPTASLHFTEDLQLRLDQKGLQKRELTLHVGAGTFKPVTATTADEHEMHAERFEITLDLIDSLLNQSCGVTAVGTTACRLLESLPILGAKVLLNELDEVFVSASDSYDSRYLQFSTREVLEALKLEILKRGGELHGETQIFMVPGFEFRLTQSLITNFHQPKSTLLMLISAFVGDVWTDIYTDALCEGYRFLSYGDGSLLRGKKNIKF
jgi:S-adenosylmethionine:tRNA ribosyltransferase-isomerase